MIHFNDYIPDLEEKEMNSEIRKNIRNKLIRFMRSKDFDGLKPEEREVFILSFLDLYDSVLLEF